MKKLLKISALTLAMSAVLFSCANPNNTNNGANNSNTPEVVKPTDVVQPEGYKPTEGAVAVKNATTGNPVVANVIPETSIISSTIMTAVPQADIIKTEEGTDKNPIYSCKPKTYNLAKNSGTLEIRKYKFAGSIPVYQDYTVNITDFATYSETPNTNIKALKQKAVVTGTVTGKEPVIAGTTSTAALFDTGTANGILVYELTSSGTSGSFTKVEFYNLDGTKSYTYTAEELKALNKMF